jgi:HAD superfamily hydrolase (TIGR01459 family)
MSKPADISGLAEIVGRFDAFLIDQFGVLRDGRGPYPEAAATLSALKAAGAKTIVLSNSGKRSRENSIRLAALGFDPSSWDMFLTSGEVAYRIMEREIAGRSGKCLLISRDGDTSPIDGLDIVRTADAEDADIILIAASEGDSLPLSHYERLLAPAARRGTPCLCTNPDKIMLTASGTAFGAGRIAELYHDLGGAVRWIGKPFPDIYAEARLLLGDIPANRICCIGDSIEHDIAGAAAAGLSSVLVATGILADATASELAGLYEEHAAVPDYVMPSFRI